MTDLEQYNQLQQYKHQIVTYYGFVPENLKDDIIKNNVKGIDRVVPIGKYGTVTTLLMNYQGL